MVPGPPGDSERSLDTGGVLVRRLDNGLRLWTRSLSTTSGGMAIGLYVPVGSLCEGEQERGFSHLLEHLAFHGGRNFPAGELERFFGSRGTTLGRHHSAHTGLDRTVYALSFPDPSPEAEEGAVACLADFAFGMELDPGTVERERRVVLEEMRGHEAGRPAVHDRMLELVLPGSRIGRRHPLGAREVIEAVDASRLRDYYERWYRPEDCAVIAAGEIDDGRLSDLVEQYLGTWRATGAHPPAPDPGIAAIARGVCEVIVNPHGNDASARIVTAGRLKAPQTRLELVDDVVREAAIRLLGRRLREMVHDDSGPVLDAQITMSKLACWWRLISVSATAASDRAVEAAAAVVGELRRISEHGFGGPEVESVAQGLRTVALRLPRRERLLPVRELLQDLMEAVPLDEPPPSAQQRAEIVDAVAGGLDPDAVRDSLMKLLAPSDVAVLVVLPSRPTPAVSPLELDEAVQAASTAPTSPPIHHPRPRRLLDRPPPPGVVRHRADVHQLGVRVLELENGVTVRMRPIEGETDRAVVHVNLAGGRILETVDQLGLTAGAAVAFSNPAPHGLSSRVIRDWLAETTVALTCVVEEDCVRLQAVSDPEDLDVSFQLIHLLLSSPRVTENAIARWQAGFERYSTSSPLPIALEIAQASLRALTGNDHRFWMLNRERARAITAATAQRWLESELCTAPMEAAVVGAIDLGRAEELALGYLGSLPARPEHDRRLDGLRRLEVSPLPVSETVDTAERSIAAVLVGWRAAPWCDGERRQPLHMASHILGQRIHREIRQDRGFSYDASCSYAPSRAYPEASLLKASLVAPPRRADAAVAAVRSLVEGFAATGPGTEEMASVRLLFADLATRAQRDPRFWARTLSELRYRDRPIGDLTELAERCLQRTAEEIRDAVAETVRPDRRLVVVCRPSQCEV